MGRAGWAAVALSRRSAVMGVHYTLGIFVDLGGDPDMPRSGCRENEDLWYELG